MADTEDAANESAAESLLDFWTIRRAQELPELPKSQVLPAITTGLSFQGDTKRTKVDASS